MNRSAIAGIFLLLSGCGASAGPSADFGVGDDEFDQTRVRLQGRILSIQSDVRLPVFISASSVDADSLWRVLPTAYDRLELEVNQGDARNRVLGFEEVRVRRVEGTRLSAYLDCGRSLAGPNADTQEVTMKMLTQIVPTAIGSEVRVQITATAQNRAHDGAEVPCRSNGRLESRMVEILEELSE